MGVGRIYLKSAQVCSSLLVVAIIAMSVTLSENEIVCNALVLPCLCDRSRVEMKLR